MLWQYYLTIYTVLLILLWIKRWNSPEATTYIMKFIMGTNYSIAPVVKKTAPLCKGILNTVRMCSISSGEYWTRIVRKVTRLVRLAFLLKAILEATLAIVLGTSNRPFRTMIWNSILREGLMYLQKELISYSMVYNHLACPCLVIEISELARCVVLLHILALWDQDNQEPYPEDKFSFFQSNIVQINVNIVQ